MTEQTSHRPGSRVVAISAAILMGAVAALVLNTLPVFLTVLARTRGLSESQSGLFAFVDMGGIALGTIACALRPDLVARLNWRGTAAFGLLILIGANVLAIFVHPFIPFLLVRLCAGIGAGIATAITYAILAEGDGARSLAIFNFVQLGAGWLAIPFLRPLADRFGSEGLFGVIAILAGVTLVLCLFLPKASSAHAPGAGADLAGPEKVTGSGWIAILAVLFHFCGTGAVFAYLGYMGLAWGGGEASVDAGVSATLLACVAGGIVVTVAGSRFGVRRSLLVGYAGLLASMSMLAVLQPVANFLLIGCLFGFTWNIVTPFQFEAVTYVDPSSSAAMLVNASTLGGIAIGPAIAGYLATSDFLLVNVAGIVTCGIAMVLLVLILNRIKRHDRLPVDRHAKAAVL